MARKKFEDIELNWKKVIFINQKKFNLSGPNGLNYYWHDLRREQDEVKWGPQLRDGLMFWGAMSYKEAIGLQGSAGAMDAEYYKTILYEGSLPAADDAMGDLRKLQQANAPIYTAEHTRCWIENNDVHVLN